MCGRAKTRVDGGKGRGGQCWVRKMRSVKVRR